MAVETLANLEVYDASTWKYPNGANKGVEVLDTTWKIVKEIYVRDGGVWKYVHPIRANTCTISTTSIGSCPSTNGYHRATMTCQGPFPQKVAGTGDYYRWQYYRRTSTVSSAHCQAQAWGFQGSTAGITSGSFTTGNINWSKPFTGTTTNLWVQFQGRILHSTYGQMTEAEGGWCTSIVKSQKTDDCGPE